jgi:8-oxo-dGTP diphosphatase
MKTTNLVAAAIINNGALYCVRRDDPNEPLYGKWELPGGRVVANEPPSQALIRLLDEKFACPITVGEQVTMTTNGNVFETIRLTTFYCSASGAEPQPANQAQAAWQPLAQFDELDWAPAVKPAVKLIAQQHPAS